MNDLKLFEEQERIRLNLKKEFREKELNEWIGAIGMTILFFLFLAFLVG